MKKTNTTVTETTAGTTATASAPVKAKRGRKPKQKVAAPVKAPAEDDPEIEAMTEPDAEQAAGDKFRHTERDPEERRQLIIRLNRIEGQVRGLRNMIENDVYCPDILVQTSATYAALEGFNRQLLDSHIRNCVKDDLINGHDETIEELLHTLHKLIK